LLGSCIKIACLVLFLLGRSSLVDVQAAQKSASTAGGEKISERMVAEPIFGGRVFILEAGPKTNPPVVLIHGLGDLASDVWRPFIPKLAQRYHVVAFDLPGFGRSQKQNALYSPGNYARFVKWAVDKFVATPPILVGHSLGGAVALRYAGTYPKALSRLVLIDVAGILERRVYTKEMLGSLAEGMTVPFDIDSLLGKMAGGLPNPIFDLDFMLNNPMLRAQVLGGDSRKIAAMALIQEDFGPYLYRVAVPAVLIWGENDGVTPLRTAALLEAALPKTHLHVISGAGHMPMTEQPQRFEAAMFSALSEEIAASTPPTVMAEASGRCSGKTGMVFTGAYESLEIIDCRDVRVTDVRAKSIVVQRSSVVFDKGEIVGKGVGLSVDRSTVTATGLKINASVALAAADSRLDLAGVQLTGWRAAITTDRRATLLFSVCRINSPHGCGTIHGLRELTAGEEL